MVRPWVAALILGMAGVTYASRVGLIGVARQFELHPLLRRALDYVPVAILAALVTPAVFAPSGRIEQPVTNIYVWAAAITALALFVTRRSWAAIALGVLSLVVLRAFAVR